MAQDDDCKARPNELGDLMDEVLVLPETTRFIRTILKRYDVDGSWPQRGGGGTGERGGGVWR